MLRGIIAVVDAEQLPDQAEDSATRDLVYSQIGYSDLVVLNKIDLADRARVDRVRDFVHGRLPAVRIVESVFADVPLDVLIGVGPNPDDSDDGDRRSTHDEHEHRFVSWVYRRSEPFDLDALARAISALPRSVYRVKGFVHAAGGSNDRHLVQAVGMRVDVSSHGEWEGEEPESCLVIIADGESIDRDDVVARFDSCRVSDDPESTN